MVKILLVEDDINLREIYAARLSAEGYELVVASDGEEALSKAVAEKPSLILLDVMMPKISGFDVLDILRSTPETKATKVVMLSALSQQSDQERGEKLGADKYLIKSQITLEDVVETVKSLLNESSTSDTAPIVTTASGRLPGNGEEKTANPEDVPTQEQGIENKSAETTIQPVDANAQGADQPATPKSTTANEIDHIDSVMQQKPPESGAGAA